MNMVSRGAHFNRIVSVVLALVTAATRAHAATCPAARLPRLLAVGGTYAVGEASLVAIRRHDWWTTPESSFHLVWDGSANRQQDRLLHAALAYQASQLGAAVFRWACLSPPAAAWMGAALGLALELPKEVGDGLHQDKGFSGPDMLGGLVGAILPAARATWAPARVVSLKVNYWPSAELRNRNGRPEPQLESDYAGQRYFLAFSPGALGRTAPWPAWLGVAVGHSVPYWASQAPIDTWYMALDLRCESLPIRGAAWRRVAWILDQVHIPAPGVRLRGGSWTFGLF
jgi:hypothetical protein